MINIYSPFEINKLRAGGKILADVVQKTLAKVSSGVTTLELDRFADQLITDAGAKPSFKMEPGYPFATCMCVNDMVVHGLPTDRALESGDILGLDCGVFYQGFHTDASWSIQVGGGQNDFLETGQKALTEAIKMCVPKNRIGHISHKIQEIVEDGGYSCVKQLVGHGVGRLLHEDPEIPCFLRGRVENTPEIKAGMILAIEVIYNQGKSPVVYANDDGWTIVTRDGLPSGLFEHTVAVTETGPEILTLALKPNS
ncbi:type I methionyl aminopeptidase [Candidatus Microgenomates bacterium]|nr:type I methionyl aminopeptidase [Candidatus Microgenomates bacterium]